MSNPGGHPPAPCRGRCPAGTDAAAYVALIAEGRIAEAYDVARAPNPMVSISGRVCAAPCESGCRRSLIDQPVSIRALKRVLTESFGVEAGTRSRWSRAIGTLPAMTRPSIGIVGAGPAGLAAAHDLRIAGHKVTLYERQNKPGGMLTYGAPPFRLPRAIAEAEFQAIIDLGVTLKTGCEIGTRRALESLLAEHAAILVAVGCHQGRSGPFPGADLQGVVHAVDFLRTCNSVRDTTSHPLQGPCVVVGGGSVALDAARSAVRRSVRDSGYPVTVVARRSREELRAPAEEVQHALEEGVELRAGFGVRRILGDTRVEAVEIAPLLSTFDKTGTYAPVFDMNGIQTLAAHTVVLSLGQQVDAGFVEAVSGITTTSAGSIVADFSGRTAHPRVFAAGDAATGPGNLIEAIAFGQRAAACITESVAADIKTNVSNTESGTRSLPVAPPSSDDRRYWTGYDTISRQPCPATAVTQRDATADVELTLPMTSAQLEASRCLRCDEHLRLSPSGCIGCALCEDICPSGCLALLPAADSVELSIDDDRCLRCRLCVDRCPANVLSFASIAP